MAKMMVIHLTFEERDWFVIMRCTTRQRGKPVRTINTNRMPNHVPLRYWAPCFERCADKHFKSELFYFFARIAHSADMTSSTATPIQNRTHKHIVKL